MVSKISASILAKAVGWSVFLKGGREAVTHVSMARNVVIRKTATEDENNAEAVLVFVCIKKHKGLCSQR